MTSPLTATTFCRRFVLIACTAMSLAACGGGDADPPGEAIADAEATASDKRALSSPPATQAPTPSPPVYHTLSPRMARPVSTRYQNVSGMSQKIMAAASADQRCMVVETVPLSPALTPEQVSQVFQDLGTTIGWRLSELLVPEDVIRQLRADGWHWQAAQLTAWKQVLDLNSSFVSVLGDGSALVVYWFDPEDCGTYSAAAPVMAQAAADAERPIFAVVGDVWANMDVFYNDRYNLALARTTRDLQRVAAEMARMKAASPAQVRAARAAARAGNAPAAAAAGTALAAAASAGQPVGSYWAQLYASDAITLAGGAMTALYVAQGATEEQRLARRMKAAVVAALVTVLNNSFGDWYYGRPVFTQDALGVGTIRGVAGAAANFFIAVGISASQPIAMTWFNGALAGSRQIVTRALANLETRRARFPAALPAARAVLQEMLSALNRRQPVQTVQELEMVMVQAAQDERQAELRRGLP
jgi:hypothetical protein